MLELKIFSLIVALIVILITACVSITILIIFFSLLKLIKMLEIRKGDGNK